MVLAFVLPTPTGKLRLPACALAYYTTRHHHVHIPLPLGKEGLLRFFTWFATALPLPVVFVPRTHVFYARVAVYFVACGLPRAHTTTFCHYAAFLRGNAAWRGICFTTLCRCLHTRLPAAHTCVAFCFLYHTIAYYCICTHTFPLRSVHTDLPAINCSDTHTYLPVHVPFLPAHLLHFIYFLCTCDYMPLAHMIYTHTHFFIFLLYTHTHSILHCVQPSFYPTLGLVYFILPLACITLYTYIYPSHYDFLPAFVVLVHSYLPFLFIPLLAYTCVPITYLSNFTHTHTAYFATLCVHPFSFYHAVCRLLLPLPVPH